MAISCTMTLVIVNQLRNPRIYSQLPIEKCRALVIAPTYLTGARNGSYRKVQVLHCSIA